MANVFLQQGDVRFLDAVRDDGTVLHTLRLFQNDHVPDVLDIDADYTEADFSGYAAVALGSWNPAFVNVDGKGEIDADPTTFEHDGGGDDNNVYGAYITDQAGLVVYAERFDAPIVMEAAGNKVIYTARLTAVSA